MRRSPHEVLVALVALAACSADPLPDGRERIAATTAAIIDGTTAPDDDAVVVVQHVALGELCSGTLVSARVVVTAKHCTLGAEPDGIAVGFGDSVADARARTVFSAEHRETPGMVIDGQDLAVVILREDAPVAPIGFAPDVEPSALLGTTVRVVGFGLDERGGVGVRRATEDRVVETGGAEFATEGPSACQGDSGGPALDAAGMLLGVTARGIEGCRGRAIFGIVSFWRELVETAIADSGACVPRDEQCNFADDDCDGELDEGCLPFGDPCTGAPGEGCLLGACLETPLGRRCTAPCDASRPLGECPPGLYCAGSGCAGFCVPGDPGGAPVGAACAADADCATLRCRALGPGAAPACVEPCRRGEGRCVLDQVCLPWTSETGDPDVCGYCVSEDLGPMPHLLGEPCARAAECASLLCVEGACALSCTTSLGCPDAFECRDVEGESVCLRRVPEPVGAPCLDELDCQSGFCGELRGVRFCTALCSEDTPCAAGASCAPASAGASACVPDRAIIGQACRANEDCDSGVCALAGAEGVCTRLCAAQAPCPAGFACLPAADATPICLRRARPEDGCSVVAGAARAPRLCVLVVLAGVASELLRRAARRRPR